MTDAGLLLVLSDPGSVPEAEFHDWYDGEHVPARTALPQFRHATRWRAADGERPRWLATYDVTDLSVLEDPSYTTLREHRSARERAVIAGLASFERRTYLRLSDTLAPGRPADDRAPFVLAVSLDVPAALEDELNRWYAEEHVPMLHAVPGWLRTRRYRLLDGTAPRWLALHDLAGTEVFDSPQYAAAVTTEDRDHVMRHLVGKERRLFAVHRRF
ncbi:MAG: hypothetical protein QM638_12945 [Nocardioides sp.]|uniref:hypothetical protein n=1 Tax=Nocardioides sp. TaxID=35761 RepID=UPI0039E5935D